MPIFAREGPVDGIPGLVEHLLAGALSDPSTVRTSGIPFNSSVVVLVAVMRGVAVPGHQLIDRLRRRRGRLRIGLAELLEKVLLLL